MIFTLINYKEKPGMPIVEFSEEQEKFIARYLEDKIASEIEHVKLETVKRMAKLTPSQQNLVVLYIKYKGDRIKIAKKLRVSKFTVTRRISSIKKAIGMK